MAARIFWKAIVGLASSALDDTFRDVAILLVRAPAESASVDPACSCRMFNTPLRTLPECDGLIDGRAGRAPDSESFQLMSAPRQASISLGGEECGSSSPSGN
jgi:hypothetical protein